MGKLIQLANYQSSYRKVLSIDNCYSQLQAFVDDFSCNVEIVQTNDEGEAITTVLSKADVALLISNLSPPVRLSK